MSQSHINAKRLDHEAEEAWLSVNMNKLAKNKKLLMFNFEIIFCTFGSIHIIHDINNAIFF